MRKKSSEKGLKHFLTIYETSVVSKSSMTDLLAMHFWQFNILNSIIIFWSTELNVFTYFPFNKKLIQLSNHSLETDLLFPEKLTNLEKYRVRLAWYNELDRSNMITKDFHGGPDALLFYEIFQRINATIVDVNVPYGQGNGFLVNNTNGTGTLGTILADEADVAINIRYYENRYLDGALVEMTYPRERDDLCLLVPYLDHLDKLSFQDNSYLLGLFNIVVGIILTRIYRLMDNMSIYKNVPKIKSIWLYFLHWSTFYGSTTQLPTNISQRVLIIFWIVYSFILNTIYSSVIFSQLATVIDNRINTVSELERFNLTIATAENMSNVIAEYFGDEKHKVFVNNLVNYDNVEEYVNIVWNLSDSTSKTAYAGQYHFVNFAQYTTPHYYVMSECPVPFLITYIVQYGSPYLEHINEKMSYLIQGGLFDKWKLNFKPNTEENTNFSNRINWDNFLLLISSFIIFYVVAIFTFFMELLMYYVKNRNRADIRVSRVPRYRFVL